MLASAWQRYTLLFADCTMGEPLAPQACQLNSSGTLIWNLHKANSIARTMFLLQCSWLP